MNQTNHPIEDSSAVKVYEGQFPAIDIRKCVETMHLYILCRKGTAEFTMDGRKYRLFQENIVLFPIGAKIDGAEFSDDFDGITMTVSRDFVLKNNPDPMWATKGYVYIINYPVLQLNLQQTSQLCADMTRIKSELDKPGHLFRRQIAGHLFQIFLYEIWDICASELQRKEHVTNNSSKIFADFLELAQKNAAYHRDVAFYSDKMCISAKYLSEIVKKCGGKPASYWINGYAAQTISDMLKDRDSTIAEISYKLGFFNPPHFSRFVRRMLGMSPSEYRTQLNSE